MPSRALVLLISIGLIDLVATAWMHANGLIVELNPLMRPVINHSEWLFAAVKGLTLVGAWVVLAWYSKYNRSFVRNACLVGALAYLALWSAWFLSAL